MQTPRSEKVCLLFLFILVFIFSCRKVTVTGDTGPPGNSGKAGDSVIEGSVHGKITQYDTLGKLISGAADVTVSLSAALTASNTSDGYFSLNPVPSGTYDYTLSKTGFGTMRYFRLTVTGGGNAAETGNLVIGQSQTSWKDIKRLVMDTLTDNGSKELFATLTLAHPQKLPYPYIILFMKGSPGSGNGTSDYAYRTYFYQPNDSTILSYPIGGFAAVSFSANLGGDYLFISAAVDNPQLCSYTDNTGNVWFPSAGKTSNEVKVSNYLKY